MFGTKESLKNKNRQGLGLFPRALLEAMERVNNMSGVKNIFSSNLVELYMGTP